MQSDAYKCYYHYMNGNQLYPRYLYPKVLESLADSPAVLIHGSRQCGKTTLTQMIGDKYGYAYYTFDNDIQRDIRDIGRINHLDVMPRLFEAIAGETATLLNVSDLSAPFQVSRPTIREYITLLSLMFLIEELPAWHRNHLKRFVKSPKIHLTDTGLVAAILGLSSENLLTNRRLYGRVVKTFVLQELKRQASWCEQEVSFSHYRDKDKVEVDIVLQAGGKLAGVEVKAGATVTRDDFKGLTKLQSIDPAAFVAGVVAYDGDAIVPFGDKLFAVPIAVLLGIEPNSPAR